MTPARTGPAARLPLRAGAALAALAAVLLALAPGFTDGVRLVLSAPVPAVPASAFHPTGIHPHTDDAYVGACTLLVRPQRDAGERTVPTGPLLFTPPHTPRVPPRPARPAPVTGHAPAGTAHVPSVLGRAPPTSSST
ncbi:hypothetical protein SUDANB15_06458 [Streptomyces sp. enrichment culture]|uniref:hypothetical protein n=1 Tax=Streptomyces sp. enrichment culture TaxID=1795815 RepID=UPI003F54315E